jgi:hypothetical protein
VGARCTRQRTRAAESADFIFVLQTDLLMVFALIAVIDAKSAALVVTLGLAPTET